jgi:hypothetical protein
VEELQHPGEDEQGEGGAREEPEQLELADSELDRLGTLTDARDLYLEEASVYRPISTGDIFLDAPVAGSTEEDLASGLTMVLSHPSAMRRGPELETRVRGGPVVEVDGLSTVKYTPKHFDVFALPCLGEVARENGHAVADGRWAAQLVPGGSVDSASLDVRQRVACLSPKGVTVLLQKLVHADTRAAVREDTIEGTIAAKLEEVEQLQTWNETLAAPKVEDGGDLAEELLSVARDFDQTVKPLAALLNDPLRRGEVWRQLSAELRIRQQASG